MENILNKYKMNNLTTTNISFLSELGKNIVTNIYSKNYYFKMFNIELEYINNFINNLNDNEVFLINPIISINCKQNEPYLTLSKQFLITNRSDPILIYNFLLNQFDIINHDFDILEEYYFLIFNYKKVYLNDINNK
jgi:hypothetical protein